MSTEQCKSFLSTNRCDSRNSLTASYNNNNSNNNNNGLQREDSRDDEVDFVTVLSINKRERSNTNDFERTSRKNEMRENREMNERSGNSSSNNSNNLTALKHDVTTTLKNDSMRMTTKEEETNGAHSIHFQTLVD